MKKSTQSASKEISRPSKLKKRIIGKNTHTKATLKKGPTFKSFKEAQEYAAKGGIILLKKWVEQNPPFIAIELMFLLLKYQSESILKPLGYLMEAIPGFDLDTTLFRRQTLLSRAVITSNPFVLKFLLEKGANPCAENGDKDNTALHLALNQDVWHPAFLSLFSHPSVTSDFLNKHHLLEVLISSTQNLEKPSLLIFLLNHGAKAYPTFKEDKTPNCIELALEKEKKLLLEVLIHRFKNPPISPIYQKKLGRYPELEMIWVKENLNEVLEEKEGEGRQKRRL